MRTIITTLFCFGVLTVFGQKKLSFTGGARSLISHSGFETNEADSVTARKSTGGYALIDLGFRINPNESTEILGMIRINNGFGGFWGSDVTFDVRQIHVKGVAAKKVRYQIGNIDYKLTPYTFHNQDFDLINNNIGVIGIKEQVNSYESFYRRETWRQQGAAADFGLAFPKIIKSVKFNGFITRLNPTNFSNILERLYGGGNIIITQSEYAEIGLNHVSLFDLNGTANNLDAYKNNVSTLTYAFNYGKDDWNLKLEGESGLSTSTSELDSNVLDDYFINTNLSLNYKPWGIRVSLGYIDNGADFRSYGAQSKRINYDQANNNFQRYTNDQVMRAVSVYDLYNDPLFYNQSISGGLMAYNPAINNALPYGVATFNRRGLYTKLNYLDTKERYQMDVDFYNLSEIRGQGTTELKSFNYLRSKLNVDISKILEWKKQTNISFGWSYQTTDRSSETEFEEISLETHAIQVGAEFEFVEQLFLVGNMAYFKSVGNEFLPQRNSDEEIINFNELNINTAENYYSAGLRFNFSEKVLLSAFYEFNLNNGNGLSGYAMNQFMLYYIMQF